MDFSNTDYFGITEDSKTVSKRGWIKQNGRSRETSLGNLPNDHQCGVRLRKPITALADPIGSR